MKPLLACLIGMALTAPALAISKNPFNDQMKQLRLVDRNGALRRAVTTADTNTEQSFKCGRVYQSGYQGMWGNLGMWVTRCKPGGDYAVFAGPDGTVQVRPCADLKGLKLPECHIRQ